MFQPSLAILEENQKTRRFCKFTGHAEVTKIVFNTKEITLGDLLTVFFATHDPITPNRQGNDIGTQYRSAIFFSTLEQKRIIEKFIKDLGSGKSVPKIVTEVKPFSTFFSAEDYHKNFYERNRHAPYCQLVISPKLEKVEADFQNLLTK